MRIRRPMELDGGFGEDTEKKPGVVSPQRRPATNQEEFRETNQFVKTQSKGVAKVATDAARDMCSCSEMLTSRYWWKMARRRLPVLDWVQYYNVKQNLLCDIVAGITVGVMHIPQGMAYAMLANVPPVIGLYVSLFPVIVYVFMGTSRHVSIGTFAVICLMLSKSVDKFSEPADMSSSAITLMTTPNHTLTLESNVTEVDPLDLSAYSSVEVVVVMCLLVGIIQVLMGILHLGALSVYLSDTLISGFTTGAAVHVFTSQFKNLFGLVIPSRSGSFKIIKVYIDIFSNIQNSNYIAIAISVCTILVLVAVNNFLNPKIKEKFKVPIPIELLVIVFGTLTSYMMQFHSVYDVKVIGFIPTGLPYPKEPRIELIPDLFVDSIAVAIVGFTVALSMAKLFSKKHKYDIDANQELLAIGAANIISSFFSCFPCSASLSRSLIQEGTGGKTQVASLVSSVFLVVIILVVGPLFESLPNCILSSIIVVALQGMFRQFKDLKTTWRMSRLDGMVWLATFLAVVLTDVDIGLAVGIGTSLLSVVLRSQRPYACLLGRTETDAYLDVSKYRSAREDAGLKIFRFCSPVYFANREFFRSELYRLAGIDPHEILSKQARHKPSKHSTSSAERENQKRSKDVQSECTLDYDCGTPNVHSSALVRQYESDAGQRTNDSVSLKFPIPSSSSRPNNNVDENTILLLTIHTVILDCSMWNFIDSAGIGTLVQIIKEYEELNIEVYLSSCPDSVMESLEKHESYANVLEHRIFPTIADVKAWALHHQMFPRIN